MIRKLRTLALCCTAFLLLTGVWFGDNNSSNYLYRSALDTLSGTGDQTVSYWFRQNASETDQGNIYFLNWAGTPDWEYSYDRVTAASVWEMHEEGTSSGNVSITHSITRGTWYHVTRRQSGTTLEGFFDGVSIGSTSFDPSGRGHSGGTGLYVGRGGFGAPWWGDLSDFCVWHRALTNGEIQQLSRRRSCQRFAGLQVWWRLNSNWYVKDWSGHGRDLTVAGSLTAGSNPPVGWDPGIGIGPL